VGHPPSTARLSIPRRGIAAGVVDGRAWFAGGAVRIHPYERYRPNFSQSDRVDVSTAGQAAAGHVDGLEAGVVAASR